MSSLARKISPATIIGDKRSDAPTQETWHYRVYGRVTSAITSNENSAFGEYTKLVGSFRATDFSTGEEYESSECFLCCGIGEMIAAQMAENPGSQIDIVYDIGRKPDPRKGNAGYQGRGYEYIIRNPAPITEQEKATRAKFMALPLPKGVTIPQLPA